MSDDELLSKLQPGAERGGVILTDGTVIEFENKAQDPSQVFFPDMADLLPYVDLLYATWHTHPSGTANLSVEDTQTFLAWPQLKHAIVGSDGVRWYAVKGKAVINA